MISVNNRKEQDFPLVIGNSSLKNGTGIGKNQLILINVILFNAILVNETVINVILMNIILMNVILLSVILIYECHFDS